MKAAVVSLRFAPGHIAHLRAYYKLFSALGCDVRLFLNSGYKPFISGIDGVEYVETTDAIMNWHPDRVLSYNIANENIRLAKKCRAANVPFFYVLHEPWDSIRELLTLRQRIPRRIAANIVNYLTSHYAHKVILASENGKQKYTQYMKRCNSNYAVFPLIFCDDYDEMLEAKRQYFSYIGGFTVMRGRGEFLDFIKYSIEKKLDYKFCIASRNHVDVSSPILQKAIREGILVVFDGKPMSSEEINLHYREAICSWNAYKSSTQSGVLPNALMQGSPVLVTNRGDSADIVTDKKQGCFISLPHNNEEIKEAFEYIRDHLDTMSQAARESFKTRYEYSVYFEKAREVYEIR